MNSAKLHGILEYVIKGKGRFPFNVEDVEENIHEVLAFFGVLETFEADELEVLRQSLTELALEEEFVEAAIMAGSDYDGGS